MDSNSSFPRLVRFEQTEQGYVAYSLYHLQESPKARKRVRRQIGLSLVIMLGLAVFLGMKSGIEPGWMIGVAFASALLLAWPKWQSILITKAVQRGLTGEGAKELIGSNLLEIREEGLFRDGPAGEMTIPWFYLIEVENHKNYLFLVFDTYPGMAIPVSSFESREEMAAFENEVRRLHGLAEEPAFEEEDEEEFVEDELVEE